MAYFTKEDVKTSIGKTDTIDDDFIDELIEEVSRDTDKITGKVFEIQDQITFPHSPIDDVDGLKLFLKTWATQIASVNNAGVVVDSSDYVLEGEGIGDTIPYVSITLRKASGLSWTVGDNPEDSISIFGKFSFSTVPPSDIKRAMIRKTVYLLLTRKEKLDKLPVWVDQIIDRYSAPYKIVN